MASLFEELMQEAPPRSRPRDLFDELMGQAPSYRLQPDVERAWYEGLTPQAQATVTRQPHLLARFLELIMRPGYAGANVLTVLAQASPRYRVTPQGTLEEIPGRPELLRQIPRAFVQGLRGEVPGSGRQVAEAQGIPDEPIIPALRNVPVLGATYRGAAGLAYDILNPFDILNYLGIGQLTRAGRSAFQAGRLAPTLAEQAAAGQRSLLSIAGRGLGELPGPVGEAVRRAEAGMLRGVEQAGRYALQIRPIQSLVDVLRSRPSGPAGTVRQILQRRSIREQFQRRQAARRYGAQRREIARVAEELGLEPDAFRSAITREAERRSREAVTVTEIRAEGVPDAPLRLLSPPGQDLEFGVDLERRALGEIVIRTPEDAQHGLAVLITDELDRMRQEVEGFGVIPGGATRIEGAPGEIRTVRWGTQSNSPEWFRQLRRSRQEVLRAFERRKGPLFERLVAVAQRRLEEGYTSPVLGITVQPSPDYQFLRLLLEDRDAWQQVARRLPVWTGLTYEVKQGDTLSSIAQRFGTTVEELAARNRIADPNRIQVGQRIEVPLPKQAEGYISGIREAQPVRLAMERAAGAQTPEFTSERIAYLHRERTPEFRAWQAEQRKKRELEDWLSQNRPVLSMRHGAQQPRHIAPAAYISEVNQAALEGRTAWKWVIQDAEQPLGQGRAQPRLGVTAPQSLQRSQEHEARLIEDIRSNSVKRPKVGGRYRIDWWGIREGVVEDIRRGPDGQEYVIFRQEAGDQPVNWREDRHEFLLTHATWRPLDSGPKPPPLYESVGQAPAPATTQATLPGTDPPDMFPGVTGKVVDRLSSAEGWDVRGHTAINRRTGQRAYRQIVITAEPIREPALPRMRIFSEDPSVIEYARELSTIRVVTTGEALDEMVERGTREGWAVRATTEDAAKAARQQGWVEITAPRFADKLKGVYFDPAAAREIDMFLRLFREPAERNAIADAIKGINRWYSRLTLFVFPEYHVRNVGTGIVKNWYAGLRPDDWQSYLQGNLFALFRQAEHLAPRSERAQELQAYLQQLRQATIRTQGGRTYTLQEILDHYETQGLGYSYFAEQFGDQAPTATQTLTGQAPQSLMRRLNPLSAESVYVDAGRAVGTFLEDTIRGALFIRKLKEGFTPEQAADIVRAYQFDYADIPDWLKTARDYAVPFITWAYKNTPNEIGTALLQPGKYVRIVKGVRAIEASQEGPPPTDEEIPDWLVLPVYMGRDDQGNPRFSNLLSMWGAMDIAQLTQEGLGFLLGQLNGIWSELIEQRLNVDALTRRPINPLELERVGLQAPAGGLAARLAERLPEGSPVREFLGSARVEHALRTFRPYSLASRFLEPDVGAQLLRSLTGYYEYPSDTRMAQRMPFVRFEDAVQYMRGQIRRYAAEEQEARRRGDERAATLARQQQERWRQELLRYILEQRPSLRSQEGAAP